MAENYKSGINILSFLFGSSSLDDLVSRVYYADKVAEHQSDAISTVLTIQEELDSQKATLETEQKRQEELVEEGKQIASELQSAVNDQQDYVNGLDEQLQEQIAAQIEAERKAAEEQARKEAEEKARKEAEEKARREAEERAAAEATQQEEPEQVVDNTPAQAEPEVAPTTTTTTESSSSSSSSSSSHAVPNLGQGVSAAIEYAKSQLGVSYSWSGSAIANQEFDCSGLVWWSFKQAGISIPRGQRLSNGRGNSMIGWCLDNGGWTTSQANLKAGDLMFWGSSTSSTGHVGMCIGGGMMIHSSWGGVEICSVYYNSGTFVGGGPIV
jgi:cell wall-associated NlpC family hydrolase